MNNYLKEIESSQLDFKPFYYEILINNFFNGNKNIFILDIGAGQGRNIIGLKRFGYNNLFATDIDLYYLDSFKSVGVDLKENNIENEKLDYENESFDVVIFSHVIEHLKTIDNALIEIYRVLKKGGIIIIETPDWNKASSRFWDDYTHIRPFSKKSIERLAISYNFQLILLKNSQINKKLILFKNFISYFFVKLSKKERKIEKTVNDINITPLKMPKLIFILYKYFPFLFFGGSDIVGILKK